jgi:hypothetical protein
MPRLLCEWRGAFRSLRLALLLAVLQQATAASVSPRNQTLYIDEPKADSYSPTAFFFKFHLPVAAACCRPGRLRLHLIVVGCLCCRQADSDSTSSSLAACAAARQTLTPPHRRWLPGSLSSRGTRHVRFDRSLLFSQITFGDEMCEDPRASYEAPFILHTLISGPGAAVSNSARTERRTAQ